MIEEQNRGRGPAKLASHPDLLSRLHEFFIFPPTFLSRGETAPDSFDLQVHSSFSGPLNLKFLLLAKICVQNSITRIFSVHIFSFQFRDAFNSLVYTLTFIKKNFKRKLGAFSSVLFLQKNFPPFCVP